jgi:hypothetical protein
LPGAGRIGSSGCQASDILTAGICQESDILALTDICQDSDLVAVALCEYFKDIDSRRGSAKIYTYLLYVSSGVSAKI